MKHPPKQPDDDVVMGDFDGAPPVPSLPGLSPGNTSETVVDGLQMPPPSPRAANTEEPSRDPQEEEASQMKSLLDAERARTKSLECKVKDGETAFQNLRREAQNFVNAQGIEIQTERRLREHTQYSLQEEQRHREDAENKLREKSSEVQQIQKRWKQAARELNTLRSQQQGFGIVTDDYLVNSAQSLRYNIQTFAIQFYGEKAPIMKKFRTDAWFINLFGAVKNLESDLLSPERRATAIQAIIWWVLVDKVFDCFRWLGQAARLPARDLHNVLRPDWQGFDNYIGSRDAVAERKFQIWSASTAALLTELDHNRQGSSDCTISPKNLEDTHLFKNTLDFLAEIPTTCDPRGLKDGIRQIFQDAIALDKEISGQVARIEWDFRAGHTNMKFDPQYMVAVKEHGSPEAIDDVRLVIAPRMIKRGKSTGDDFEVENQLLPMQVSLMLAPENDGGGGKGLVKAVKGLLFGN